MQAKKQRFKFKIEGSGKSRIELVWASSLDAALEAAASEDFRVSHVADINVLDTIRFSTCPKKINARELSVFFKTISRSIRVGVSLPASIKLYASQSKSAYSKGVFGELCLMIGRQGLSFSDALQHFPEHFSLMVTALVQAGERTGDLDKTLFNLGAKLEKNNKVLRGLISSLFYPMFVLLLTGAAFLGATYYVIPQLITNFEDFNVELPVITKAFILFSDFLHEQWILLPIISAFVYLCIKSGRNIFQSEFIQKIILNLPVIGSVLQSTILARCLDTLGTLLKSGCDIITAYTITQNVSGNPVYKNYFSSILERLKQGESPETAYQEEQKRIGAYGSVLAYQMKLSKHSGETDTLMHEIAQNLSEEAEMKINELPKLLQPILMGFISALIGLLVAAIYLPTFSLLEGIMQ